MREAQLLPAAGCTRARRDHACHYATGNSVVPKTVIGLLNASTISPDMPLWIKCLPGTNLQFFCCLVLKSCSYQNPLVIK